MDAVSEAALNSSIAVSVGAGAVGAAEGAAGMVSPLDPQLIAVLTSPSKSTTEALEATRQRALRLFQTGYAVDMAELDVDEEDPYDVPVTRQVLFRALTFFPQPCDGVRTPTGLGNHCPCWRALVDGVGHRGAGGCWVLGV